MKWSAVGVAHDVHDAVTGRDLLTGERLAWWERGLAVWGTIPIIGLPADVLQKLRKVYKNDVSGSSRAESAVSEAITLSKTRFGHTFSSHGQDATEFLTRRAAGSGMPQGQFLDDQVAASFINEHIGQLGSRPVSLPVPEGFPARVIMPDGRIVPAITIRLVPNGRGVKTAYPEP